MWNHHFPFWIQSHWVPSVAPCPTPPLLLQRAEDCRGGLPGRLVESCMRECGTRTCGLVLCGLLFGQPACCKNKAHSSCSFRARISCLGFSLEDPILKGTAFTSSNQIPQWMKWGGLKLLVILKAKATSIVVYLNLMQIVNPNLK